MKRRVVANPLQLATTLQYEHKPAREARGVDEAFEVNTPLFRRGLYTYLLKARGSDDGTIDGRASNCQGWGKQENAETGDEMQLESVSIHKRARSWSMYILFEAIKLRGMHGGLRLSLQKANVGLIPRATS